MPKKRFSDEQIALALRQADTGTAVAEICRKLGRRGDGLSMEEGLRRYGRR